MTNPLAQAEPKAAALTSPDVQAERLAQLRRLMPDLFDGEGKLDETALRALTQPETSTPVSERFRFEWAGKHQSKRFAFTPSRGTLVADKARSTPDFDTTQNLIIEGDNLEVLKLLQATYFERVKCIYIDPPYNTGNDFIYPDNFGESKKAYWQKNGTIKDGVKLTSVTESNGRRHSNWLNMMQSRLLLARQLLRPDGVIFISINDNEQANLKKLCDEVFGGENFVANIVWQRSKKGDSKTIAKVHEYILSYTKNKDVNAQNGAWRLGKPGINEVLAEYESARQKYIPDHSVIRKHMQEWYRSLPDGDPRKAHKHYNWSDDRGLYFAADFAGPDDGRKNRPRHDIFHPITRKPCKKPSTGWRWDEEKTKWALSQEPPRIHFGEDENTIPNRKSYLFEVNEEPFSSVFYMDGRSATLEVEDLVGKGVFQFPKNKEALERLFELSSKDGDLILDFFAGSGTTAHAVMKLNAENRGGRRYILVQVPEYTDEASAAYQAGYKTISGLCIERVKQAGLKIREEHSDVTIDTGFRVYRLTDSHFPENLFTPDPNKTDEENRAALDAHLAQPRQQSIFAEAVFDDVVTELALKNGFGLFYTLERLDSFPDNSVYRLSGNDKAALLCLDDPLQETTLEQLEAHSDEQLFCSRRALNTTKKWTLQASFKDNLWVV